jgi:hypothetical protein
MVYREKRRSFDISIPKGVIFYGDEDVDRPYDLQAKISEIVQESTHDSDSARYSPVRDALEAVPRVFISYAHADRESAAAVDQWLRDHNVRVDIDEREFIAGRDLRNEIKRCIQNAGKVIYLYSEHSSNRYFTNLERRIVEELENISQNSGSIKSIMIYFRTDKTELPLESAGRLAINAWQMGFEDACTQLLRPLIEKSGEPKRISLAKYKKRAPWHKYP